MSEIKTTQNPDFFGKGGLTAFLGVVEDVNDPKQAGRVKARCVGIHPKDKNELKTEDLPWARVSAPTTHAQQGRVGAKHGLLPGCWVWGFFLDGEDQQDLMICGSFPFTAGASKQDFRTRQEDSKIGTQDESVQAFDKHQTNPRHPNVGVLTTKEKGGGKRTSDSTDRSGDAPSLTDAKSGECGERRAASNEAKEDKMTKPDNTHSQNYTVKIGDGGCGNVPHAQADTQRIMKENMPSQHNRLNYGDQVWNKYTGSFMNMNGIMNQIAMDLCGKLKMLIVQQKAVQEDSQNRTTRAQTLQQGTTRDGEVNTKNDDALTIKDDMFHVMMSQFMDQLCSMLMSMLQQMDQNSGDESDSGDRSQDEQAKIRLPGLNDPGSDCVAEAIVNNVKILTDEALSKSYQDVDAFLAANGININVISTADYNYEDVDFHKIDASGWGDFDMDFYAELNAKTFNEVEKEAEDESNGSDSSGTQDLLSQFGSILSMIGSVQGIMSFSSIDKYGLQGSMAHNRAGNETQDKRTKKGSCQEERIYDTVEGVMNAMSGAMGAFGGGGGAGGGGGTGKGSYGDGSNDGSNNDTQLRKIRNIGWGGQPPEFVSDYTDIPCEDARIIKVPDSCITEDTPEWDNVKFAFIQNLNTLKGEKIYQGKLTENDRVLVAGQFNRSENGIYRTRKGDWIRTNDADGPNDFVQGKIIRDSFNKLYEYAGNNFPAIDRDDIQFNIVVSDDRIKTKVVPSGRYADAFVTSLPSADPVAAENFKKGVPNVVVIRNPGELYGYNNPGDPAYGYPSVYIPGYNGTPVPIVSATGCGELVGVLINPKSFDPSKPNVGCSVIPDSSPIGIKTDDPNFDFNIGGIHIDNIGDGYEDPEIIIIDRDTGKPNGEVKPTIMDGRIVNVEVINSGVGFKRAPEIILKDPNGAGAKLKPIMSAVPKPNSIPFPIPVQMIFCPGKNQKNLI